MMQLVEKEIDPQGRIVLPKSWIASFPKKVIVIRTDNGLTIVPKQKSNLVQFFDAVKVDIKSDLADWHAVKKELMKYR